MTAAGSSAPSCRIVVVNFGSSNLLEENLVSLSGGLGELHPEAVPEVVVVDSLHSSAERERVEQLAVLHGWHLLKLEGNRGFGAAVNEGAALDTGQGWEHLLLLNPDVAMRPQVLVRLLERAAELEGAALSPRVERPDGSDWSVGNHLDMRLGRVGRGFGGGPERIDWLSGACLLVPRAMWVAAGGFDERYFLYWEDVELSFRLGRLGADQLVMDDLVVVHDVGGTQAGSGKSRLFSYFMCRNRLLFASLHVPARELVPWVIDTPSTAWRVACLGGRRALLSDPSPLFGAIWGTVSGLGLLAATLVRPTGRSPQRVRRTREA